MPMPSVKPALSIILIWILALAVSAAAKPVVLPKVTRVIHSADGHIGQLESSDVPRALGVLEAGLRDWDVR